MAQAERRLAAIMYTDMVGYTALGQRNESLALALVEEQRKLIRPILARHRGREVKTIGDAFLVEFHSGLDGARCSYDIQRAVREFNISLPEEQRIHLRIGLHLGDVVESHGDISGDAVNVASRIEALSEDGGVCLTRQVYDQVHNKLDLKLESMGPRQLKNVSAPIELFRMTMPWEGESETPSQRITLDKRRVAVLPFANMSPDPNDEYFADGMTEELITSLSGLNQLSVIARTSVMKYKGSSKGASEVARELNSGTIVEGSVRKAGNRVRITVQLIDGPSESHLWAHNYDKQLDDIFATQSDVAKQVAETLQIKLLSDDKKKLEKVPTSNVDAYTLYLKGMFFFFNSWGNYEGIKKAIAHFEEAVANDPNFALAYAYLAFCHNQMAFFGVEPSAKGGALARKYVDRALALDDSLAEAHQVNSRVLRNYEWDFAAAEKECSRAIELNPSYVEAYGGRGLLLSFDRRFAEAIPVAKRILELDPASSSGWGYAATIYLYAGRTDDAIDLFERILKIEPTNMYAKGNLGLAHVRNGMTDLGVMESVESANTGYSANQSDLAYVYAKAGMVPELRKHLETLLKGVNKNHELSVAIASAYANLGETDKAIEWLNRAYTDRVSYLVSANSDFVFDAVRSDPRFRELMRKVG